jgi:hypothetical protein
LAAILKMPRPPLANASRRSILGADTDRPNPLRSCPRQAGADPLLDRGLLEIGEWVPDGLRSPPSSSLPSKSSTRRLRPENWRSGLKMPALRRSPPGTDDLMDWRH